MANGLSKFAQAIIKGMRDENAMLLDKIDAKEHDSMRNLREYKRVCDENDELRLLVRGLWYCTENETKAVCEGCPLGPSGGLNLTCERMMHELGIEVDA